MAKKTHIKVRLVPENNPDSKFIYYAKKPTKGEKAKDKLKFKKYKKDIIDKRRIKVILKNISKKSKNMKIDPKITNRIWKSMIKAYIDYEYRNFGKK